MKDSSARKKILRALEKACAFYGIFTQPKIHRAPRGE
jgi:hypothetical protein